MEHGPRMFDSALLAVYGGVEEGGASYEGDLL